MADSDTMETRDLLIEELQTRANLVEKRLLDLTVRVLNLTEEFEVEMSGVKRRLSGVEGRLEDMGQNITAIMRHLGA